MNTKNLCALLIFLGTVGVWIWGCQSNQPIKPYKNVALSVSLPQSPEVKDSLLGVASNEILYRVDGAGLRSLAKGTVGPFSTSASSGSVNFTMDIPAQDSLVLTIQLNDASTHQPLAVGATGLNMISSPVTDVVVEMGSVTRNCYTLIVPGTGGMYFSPEIYTFSTDILAGNAFGQIGDFQLNYNPGFSTPLTIGGGPVSTGSSLPMTTVAYLGNGDFVDYDYVPSTTAFQTDSGLAKGAPISVNDIFCIELVSIPVSVGGGHAWIQVTNPGNGTLYAGPQFRYRVNGTLPYFAYEQTNADLGAPVSGLPVSCSGSW